MLRRVGTHSNELRPPRRCRSWAGDFHPSKLQSAGGWSFGEKLFPRSKTVEHDVQVDLGENEEGLSLDDSFIDMIAAAKGFQEEPKTLCSASEEHHVNKFTTFSYV